MSSLLTDNWYDRQHARENTDNSVILHPRQVIQKPQQITYKGF